MTPEFGAASQLEKIDMLDFADVVAIDEFELPRGAEDADADVSAAELVRNREVFGKSWKEMPVFGTSAATFNDDGVTSLYHHLRDLLTHNGLTLNEGRIPRTDRKTSSEHAAIIPPQRVRYLAEIAETVRSYHSAIEQQVAEARQRQHLRTAAAAVAEAGADAGGLPELGAQALPAEAAELHRHLARGGRIVLRGRDGGDRPGPGAASS